MNPAHNLTPAALYARVSSNRQDVALSVPAELRALREYADGAETVEAVFAQARDAGSKAKVLLVDRSATRRRVAVDGLPARRNRDLCGRG